MLTPKKMWALQDGWMMTGNPNSILGFPWSKAFPKLSKPKISVFPPKNQSAYKSIGMHYLTHSLTLFESRSLKEHMTVQEPDS